MIHADYTEIPVGKGLHNQIEFFTERNDLGNVLVLVNDELEASFLEECWVDDENDYINHGRIAVENAIEPLAFHLDSMFNKKEKKVKKYYHLIASLKTN